MRVRSFVYCVCVCIKQIGNIIIDIIGMGFAVSMLIQVIKKMHSIQDNFIICGHKNKEIQTVQKNGNFHFKILKNVQKSSI